MAYGVEVEGGRNQKPCYHFVNYLCQCSMHSGTLLRGKGDGEKRQWKNIKAAHSEPWWRLTLTAEPERTLDCFREWGQVLPRSLLGPLGPLRDWSSSAACVSER